MAKKSKIARAKTARPASKRAPARKAATKKGKTGGKAIKQSRTDSHVGRALVTQDEKLYMLFKEDFHARQIFEFLRAETVRDLEQFSAQQIVKLLSQPIQRTVERIRQRLAEKNRHLAGDEQFAAEFKRQQRGS